jgi:hypothetical protein
VIQPAVKWKRDAGLETRGERVACPVEHAHGGADAASALERGERLPVDCQSRPRNTGAHTGPTPESIACFIQAGQPALN